MLHPVRMLLWLDDVLAKLEGFFLSSILLVALSFSFLQVVLRNFFDSGIGWGDVFARHLVLWIAFFGATLSTREDKHIKIDALLKVMPAKIVPVVNLLVTVFCVIVTYLLSVAAWRFMVDEKMSGSILFGSVPTWYFISIMPVGFAVITFRFVVIFIKELYKFSGKKLPTDKHGHVPHHGLDISVNIKVS